MFIIILINLFIVWDVFFRNNIGLNSQQFLTLFILVMTALAITYITHRIRYIFMSIVGIGILFVLLTGILPLYETIPNTNDFIQTQTIKIVNQWANEGTISIKNTEGNKQIPIKELISNDINIIQKTQISFASRTQEEMEKIFIDLGNGSFINLNPQSAITLEQSWANTNIQILQGDIKYYIPWELSWIIQIIGKYKGTNIQQTTNGIRAKLVRWFEQKKDEFFVSQIWGSMVLNPVIHKSIGFFIKTLYAISPKTYQKNLTNYNTIQQYFTIKTWETSNKTWENIKNVLYDIISQAKKWAEETSITQRFNNKKNQ